MSPGSPVGEYPRRKETPKITHARRRPGKDAPSDKHELCDRKCTCPRRRPRDNTHASPSYPVHSPQTLRKPLSDTPKRLSEDPPLRALGARLSGGRPRLRTPHCVEGGKGCYVTLFRRPVVRGAVGCWSMVQVGFTQNKALNWRPDSGFTCPREVSTSRMRFVSHGVITSGSLPERFEICVSRTCFHRESQRPFRTDRIRPAMRRIHVSPVDCDGTRVGARCPAVTVPQSKRVAVPAAQGQGEGPARASQAD